MLRWRAFVTHQQHANARVPHPRKSGRHFKGFKIMAKTSKNVAPVMTNLNGQTLLTLRTLTEKNPASLATYEKLGGYQQLKRLVSEK